MQEIIGYGGGVEELLSSEEDEEEEEVSVSLRLRQLQRGRAGRSPSSSSCSEDEHMTVEEKNILNITKKNTDFNSRSVNFLFVGCGEGALPGGLRGGKKGSSAPLVTVTQFGVKDGDSKRPGKVNRVSPSVTSGESLVKKVEAQVERGRGGERSKRDMEELDKDKTGGTSGRSVEVTTRFDSEAEQNDDDDHDREVEEAAEEGPSMCEEVAGGDQSPHKSEGEKRNASNARPDEDDDNGVKRGGRGGGVKMGPAEVEGKKETRRCAFPEKPQVKLSRKSPYVTSSILKGTPKPVVIVKNKPPVPGNKPKLPNKPKSLKAAAPKSPVNYGKSPVAAPRKASFRNQRQAGEYANVAEEIQAKNGGGKTAGAVVAESYNSEADVQNEVIFEVNATMVSGGGGPAASKSEPLKREEALERIRKSLEANQEGKDEKKDSSNAVGFVSNLPCRASSSKRQAPKPPTTTSTAEKSDNNRNERGASSGGGGGERGEGNQRCEDDGTKKSWQKQKVAGAQESSSSSSSSPSSGHTAISPAGKMTRHSSLRPSSGDRNRGEGSGGHRVQFSLEHEDLEETRRRKEREVAETTEPNPISYNQWITRGAALAPRQPVNGIIESSFTGQPIQVLPPSQTQAQAQAQAQAQSGVVMAVKPPMSPSPLPAAAASPAAMTATSAATPAQSMGVVPVAQKPLSPADDEVRKWTEKKRSKSQQPRGSEIEELRGSSKAKPKPRFFPQVTLPMISSAGGGGSNGPAIKRPSRVELYEADRRHKAGGGGGGAGGGKFSSFGRILRQLAHTSQRIGGSHGELYSRVRGGFLDEEHEREIIERDRSKQHLSFSGRVASAVSIVHPMDLSGAVEVVPIRPHAGSKVGAPGGHGHFAKNKAAGLRKGAAPVAAAAAAAAGGSSVPPASSSSSSSDAAPTTVVTKSILKARVEYSDSKDSGHETSSIHTDNSDNSSNCSNSAHGGSSTSGNSYSADYHNINGVSKQLVFKGGGC